jgi:anti-sigma B factor antagonist
MHALLVQALASRDQLLLPGPPVAVVSKRVRTVGAEFTSRRLQDYVGLGVNVQDIISMKGRVTIDNSGEMRERLAVALKPKPAEVTIDFSRVTYIETSGLATLVEAFRTARRQGTRLLLTGMQGQPRDLLAVTRLDHLFDTAAE